MFGTSRYEKLHRMISATGNPVFIEALIDYHNEIIENIQERIDKYEELKKDHLKRNLKYEKLADDFHDTKIETHHLINEAKDDFTKAVAPFFEKLPNVTKVVVNRPRTAGMLLLLLGHKWIYDVTNIDLDKVIKETAHGKQYKPEVSQE